MHVIFQDYFTQSEAKQMEISSRWTMLFDFCRMLGCYDALQKKYVSLPVSFSYFKCIETFIYVSLSASGEVTGHSGWGIAEFQYVKTVGYNVGCTDISG